MKQWLDRVTGTVTMYKLVLIVLIAIGVIALALSALDLISADPLPLLASAAVAVAVAFATSWLAARALRVTPHSVSALITGLLIFFIMQPKFDVPGLVGIALAAVVASLSKYLLAVRGRHVFNPAALGVFVIGIVVFSTGSFLVSYPSWWVGTSALLIPVAIGAFLVLYRTQHLTMGVVFVVVAFAIGFGGALLRGGSMDASAIQGALSLALLSSPIVFLAGFMLSEPLTLPPRRWQQLLEATLVAVLVTVPFAFGPVTNTPHLALLAGNLLAFFFGQRRGINLTYLGKTQVGPTAWELAFQPARAVRYLPGQYMELTIPHRKADFRGSRRYFSISSAPESEGPITFAITLPEKSSSFKRALLDLEPGTIVRGTSVGGDFLLPKKTDEPLLLVAGGIGITPFASQLAHARAIGEKRDVVVAYATSTTGPLPYASLLEETGVRVIVTAPKPPVDLPNAWIYAGPRLTRDVIEEYVPDAASRRAFVSGPPSLVNAVRVTLRSLGARRVTTDYFSGY